MVNLLVAIYTIIEKVNYHLLRDVSGTKMKTISIDFGDCKYAQDLYEETIKAMDFPVRGIEKLNKELQQEALEIFEVFVDAEQEYGDIHPISD